jgi:omega-3 fatty acid desaturase (delta-15 desaturase)
MISNLLKFKRRFTSFCILFCLFSDLVKCGAFTFHPSSHSSPNLQTALSVATVNVPGPPTKTPVIEPSGERGMNEDQSQMPEEQEMPTLNKLRKMLPKESFQVDTATSVFYFLVDLAAVVSSIGFLDLVVTSDKYHSFPWWEQAILVAPLQVLAGFAMWCMWCIGHDAGHNTVSNKAWVNNIVGEIAHSVCCLTPFHSWKKSHLQHHLNHNHLTNDFSHQWFIREEKDKLHPIFQLSYETRNLQLPLLYMVYLLLGVPDGGHVFFYGRMWEGESMKEKCRGAISVAISMATAGSLWMQMGTADFAVVCMMPWLVLSFWLFMVTYLQHHSEDGKLYTDDTWTFTRGAFETVDRDYGKWINRMSHHMMDGHVVHHLFFNKVPHYRLEEATLALQDGLEKEGLSQIYKKVDTYDFTQEIVKQFNDNWFFIDEKQVVRK